MRNRYIVWLLAGLLALGTLLLLAPGFIANRAAQPGRQRPNILFIISDDHTSQAISAYGSRLAQTPNIDRIAREGALLYNNVVANSICGPSRATLLTGKYSHMNGYKFNERQFNINQPVFPEELQKSGYQTAWIGKMHLGSLPHGFDYLNVLPGHGHYYNSDFVDGHNQTKQYPGYVTNVITQLATQWLSQRDTVKPFFLVVGHKATHREWLPDVPDLGAYDQVSFPVPPTFYDTFGGRPAAQQQEMSIASSMRLKEDLKVHLNYEASDAFLKRLTPDQKAAFRAYYEEKVSRDFDSRHLSGKALAEWKYQRYLADYLSTANSLDRNIGTLLAYLDKTGLSQNTVVIYTSDQGFYLGEHGWFDKRFIYEESLKTPFVIRYPGVIKPGTRVRGLVSNVDWAPTLLQLAGTPIPADLQGRSFLPLLQAGKAPIRQAAYYHYYEYPQEHKVAPHFGIRTDRYTLARFYGPVDAWELYDIQKDPHNLNNLYGTKGYEALTASLTAQLRQEIRAVKDTEALTLLDGGSTR